MFIIMLLLWIISLSVTYVFSEPCTTSIVLEPYVNVPVQKVWQNVSTELICPAEQLDWAVWFSSITVYKQMVGCELSYGRSLSLDWFPNVQNITAILRSYSTGQQTTCIFTSSKGFLVGTMQPQMQLPQVFGNVYSTQIVYNSSREHENQVQEIDFVICKRKARNGSCITHPISENNGRPTIKSGRDYSQIIGKFDPERNEWYECFVNIDGTPYHFKIDVEADVNECERAALLDIKLCKSSPCIDLLPGYRCEAGDYTHEHSCKEMSTEVSGWNCHHTASYDQMSDKCLNDVCLKAAKMGYLLCSGGVRDCIPSGDSYQCRHGSPMLDYCKAVENKISVICPEIKMEDIEESFMQLAGNIDLLKDQSPETLINITSQFSNEDIEKDVELMTPEQRMDLVNKLLDLPDYSDTDRTISSPDESLKDLPLRQKFESIRIIGVVAREDPNVWSIIHSPTNRRTSLQIVPLQPDTETTDPILSNGNVFVISLERDQPLESNASASPPPIVAIVPKNVLERGSERKPNKKRVGNKTVLWVLHSDVTLIDRTDSHVHYKVDMKFEQAAKEGMVCQQYRSVYPRSEWDDNDCITIMHDLHNYECVCKATASNMFAMALVYIVGDANLSEESALVVNMVSYIFTAITIVALTLFLFFSRFIGIFQLDQFNIAFCLLLFSITSLFLPIVGNNSPPVMCTFQAIAMCFFVLAAFSWKCIFGLNTLMLVRAPYSEYHIFVSTEKRGIPILWIGYFMPAGIIAIWFGYTQEVINNDLCIGPSTLRWLFIGPITTVVVFNLCILCAVGVILLRSYMLTRKSRVNKSTHLLVLSQLTLTLGIPYISIYLQFIDNFTMLLILPIAMALSAVLMFFFVAIVDSENRDRLRNFVNRHSPQFSFSFRSNEKSGSRLPLSSETISTTRVTPSKFIRPEASNVTIPLKLQYELHVSDHKDIDKSQSKNNNEDVISMEQYPTER